MLRWRRTRATAPGREVASYCVGMPAPYLAAHVANRSVAQRQAVRGVQHRTQHADVITDEVALLVARNGVVSWKR